MPLVSSKATPVAIDIVPSVTMNGETRRNATQRPLIRPTATPHAKPGEHAEHDDGGASGRACAEAPPSTCARHDAGQRDDRADRQVEAADDEHQHLPGRDDDEKDELRRTLKTLLQRRGSAARTARGATHQHDQQDRQEPDAASRREQPLRARIGRALSVAERADRHRPALAHHRRHRARVLAEETRQHVPAR